MTTDTQRNATFASIGVIPVISVEEHNEALIAIAWAIENRGFPDVPATFVNVDHHSDLDIPRVFKSLHGMPHTVQAMRNAVGTEISIASFIWAGTYIGMFDKVYWLSPASPFAGGRPRASMPPKELFIATTDADRREFLTAVRRSQTDDIGNDDRRPLSLHFMDATQPLVLDAEQSRGAWILSIDLDYFSCNSTPESGFQLPVSEAVHDAVRDDPRHPLRMSVYHRVAAKQDTGKYWLEFDMFPLRTADPLVRTADEIDARIEGLRVVLESSPPPGLVIIARSRLSGFTPSSQWCFIEGNVLKMLRSIYKCEEHEGDTLW